jgi:CheY-like chemotaxis protein
MVKRIVIADDSVTIQKAFAMTFGGEDVTLMAARSADEGLSMARQLRPDLVIADGIMPGRSGYELCSAIKADPALQATAVYILASSHQPYDEERGRQSGSDGHFLKPFDTNTIIDQVRDALAKGPSAARPVVPEPPQPLPPPPGARQSSPQIAAAAGDDDEYGELVVEGGETAVPASARPTVSVTSGPAPTSSVGIPVGTTSGSSGSAPSAMRPSLIPGMRPGAAPLARPGTLPVRPLGPGAAPAPPSRTAAPPMGRTLMGVPAASLPIPGSSRAAGSGLTARAGLTAAPSPARPSVVLPASVSIAPGAGSPLSAPARPGVPPTVTAGVANLVGSAVDQKVAAFAAKGPEYEAIAKLSREIIEQIAWEIVPELAEAILREQAEKRGPR